MNKNNETLEKIDQVVAAILDENKSNKYRDKFFPKLITALNYKVALEIGVDKGDFTKHLLSSNAEMVYGVDPWIDDFGSDCKPGYFDPNGINRMNQAQENLKDFIPHRCKLIKDYSVNAAKSFGDNSIDFIYIDGDHSLEMIFDIYSWIPKLKVGGILSGHDFKDGPRSGLKDFYGEQLDYEVKRCVDYYGRRYGHKINSIGGRILNWWFVKT